MANEVLYSQDIYTTKNFTVRFEALVEHEMINSDMMDESMVQETIDSVNSDELVHFCAKVSFWFDGMELATDYLGSCFYESYEAFHTTYKTEYFHDMAQRVINEGKKELDRLRGLLCKGEQSPTYTQDQVLNILNEILIDYSDYTTGHEAIRKALNEKFNFGLTV